MEYIQEIKVLYGDTDSYGVVWHGAYTKWFEAARAGFVEKMGFDLAELEAGKVLFPVTEMNIRYKSSAKVHEIILIKSCIIEVKPFCVMFEHNVYEKSTGILRVSAHINIAAINPETGKIYRRMPENLLENFEKAMK